MIGGLGLITMFFALHWSLNWYQCIDKPKKIPMGKNIFKWIVFIIGWVLIILEIAGQIMILSGSYAN